MTVSNNKDEYYQQDDMWGRPAEEYQHQVLMDILSMIPGDAASILDVGCGDGHITNYLPKALRVIGLDISTNALKHVKREAIIGDITHLPFPDKSIDLVMANDVLEHIPDSDYFKALSELQRVAKKYIMITLPYDEDYQSRLTQCAKCGCIYHINWHQRGNTLEDVMKLSVDDEWAISEVRFSGEDTLPPHDPTQELKHELGYYDLWPGSICPNCGSDRKATGPEEETVLRVIDAARHSKWFPRNRDYIPVSKSEVIALYTSKDSTWEPGVPAKVQVCMGSLQEVDFSNRLQAMDLDFIPGLKWPRFLTPKGAEVTDEGICISQADRDFYEVQTRFPITPEAGDCIQIMVRKTTDKSGKIAVYSIDGISVVSSLLYEAEIHNMETTIEFTLQNAWSADKFGLPISVHADGSVILCSMKYLPAGQSSKLVPFLPIHKGHNVFTLKEDQLCRIAMGYYSSEEGRIPIPQIPQSDGTVDILSGSEVTRKDLLQETQKSIYIVQQKMEYLSSLSETKEAQRSQAEKAYANAENNYKELQKQVDNLGHQIDNLGHQRDNLEHRNLSLTEKLDGVIKLAENIETQRDNAERLYQTASQYVTFWHRNLNRRVQRILVFSHMYPTEENPIGGSFIHEQVKALRDIEGLDARVISCRPYWLNGVNFYKILRANKLYPQYLADTEWTVYDGVPVLYLPYRVGVPLLPFHTHGWTYSDAIIKAIGKVWKEFKFDLIHAHTAYLDGNAALAVSKRYKVPYLITEHTGPFTVLTDKPIVRQKTLKAIRNADKVFAVSDALATKIRSYFADQSIVQHIGVLYNGVLTDLFRPLEIQEEKINDKLKIMYVGYLEEVKDPFNLIEAFKKIHVEFPNAYLKIVGDGLLKGAVVNMASELGIDGYVEILGLQPREKVAEFMRSECDVLVLPSRSETFGVVLVEALASGKPVVATKCGGPESIVTESYLGELCDKEDSSALAEAIMKVLRQLTTYDSKQIRHFIMENFSMSSLSGTLAEIYQKM